MTELITTAEAAARLGISPQRVRQYVAKGRLPAQRITSRLYLIPAAAVRKFRPKDTGRPRNSDS